MNRSFGNNYKQVSTKKDRQSNTQKSSVEFQTLYKSRNDHSLVKTTNVISKKNINRTEASQPLENDHVRYQMKAHQQIKNYVKSLRKSQKESQQERVNYESAAQPLKSICQQSEIVKSQSQPQFANVKKQIENLAVPQPQTFSLDILQKKVQDLLELKLLSKCQNKGTLSLRTYQDELEKQLQGLIQEIRQISQKEDSPADMIDQQIKDIAQKIGIFQKIIAESFTQSQILKKYFFMKKLSRKPFTVFDNQLRKNQEIEANLGKNLTYVPQHPSLHYSSISRSSYSKPPREAYQRQSKRPKNVLANHQSLGRSSYQTDFLNYGALPTYPRKIQQELNMSTSSKLESKDSVYKTDFKQKKVCLEDSKNLDCRRDKFRPTPITFMPKKMMNNKQNKRQNGKTPKKYIRNPSTLSFASIYNDSSLLKNNSNWFGSLGTKTQYSTNFAGEKSIIDCLAKETNLTNLKYEFRRNANA